MRLLNRSLASFRGLAWTYSVFIPLFSIFLLFNVAPLIKLFDLAFQSWARVVSGQAAQYDLSNFQRLAADAVFQKVVGNTLLFAALRVPLGLGLGLLIALAIDRTKLMRGLFIAAWFSPFMTSVVAMALVFTYFYNPTFGLFDFVLAKLGLGQLTFLQSPTQALPSIVLIDLWKTVGFNVVIFLAGLSAIPAEYYDAAHVDGATPWQAFTKLTLPLLSRTTYLLIVMNTITATRVFVPVYMMTGFNLSSGGLGGPLNSTNVMTLFMYESAFRFGDFGYASAAAVVLFAFVTSLTLVQLRFFRVEWDQ